MEMTLESQGTNSSMSLEAGAKADTDRGGTLLTSLLFLITSANFLIQPRPTC